MEAWARPKIAKIKKNVKEIFWVHPKTQEDKGRGHPKILVKNRGEYKVRVVNNNLELVPIRARPKNL